MRREVLKDGQRTAATLDSPGEAADPGRSAPSRAKRQRGVPPASTGPWQLYLWERHARQEALQALRNGKWGRCQ